MTAEAFDYWDFFVQETRRNPAPLYEQFALGVARDDQLKAFANEARPGQPRANVLFAAVHFLLLRGAQHPLRRFYPNLNGGNHADDLDQAFPAFRDFVTAHRPELSPLVRSRVTNTNEVGRSAILHAGFRAVAKLAGEPLHLIELGPSAGLNLIWDRYGVRYLRDGHATYLGAPDARLVLETELRGALMPPSGPTPRVASRVGLERNPVDLSSGDERDWLKALVWPDQVARFAALERALEIRVRETPSIRQGDALELLPDALSEIPPGETACVYHSFVTYQFSDEKRAALDDLLIAASLRRPVWRLSWEGTLSGDAPLLLYAYRDGIRTKRLLALCQPHGAWMEWRDGKAS
ncbi:MAG TPA: DUF2332 domain-containing protein [Rhizomicrobium sp.]|jgi:hypothetical protein|nr:DUF2332 domain-containing protein [Rhizomicrobium sp.]